MGILGIFLYFCLPCFDTKSIGSNFKVGGEFLVFGMVVYFSYYRLFDLLFCCVWPFCVLFLQNLCLMKTVQSKVSDIGLGPSSPIFPPMRPSDDEDLQHRKFIFCLKIFRMLFFHATSFKPHLMICHLGSTARELLDRH